MTLEDYKDKVNVIGGLIEDDIKEVIAIGCQSYKEMNPIRLQLFIAKQNNTKNTLHYLAIGRDLLSREESQAKAYKRRKVITKVDERKLKELDIKYLVHKSNSVINYTARAIMKAGHFEDYSYKWLRERDLPV